VSTVVAEEFTDRGQRYTLPVNTIVHGVAKSWANFNGTGTVSVGQSLNCSSISDVNTGQYGHNMTTAMTTAAYAQIGGLIGDIGWGGTMMGPYGASKTVSYLQFLTIQVNTPWGGGDCNEITACFYGLPA
jgi:hypothetical protein